MTIIKIPSKHLDNINIEVRIESLRSLIDLIKAGIEMQKTEALHKIEKLKGKVEDELDAHEVHTEEEIFELEYVNNFEGSLDCSQIENMAAYSIITICYMLFETNLVAFANIAKEHYFIELKLGCLKKPSITKFYCPGNGPPFILYLRFLICNLAIRFFELHQTATPFIM